MDRCMLFSRDRIARRSRDLRFPGAICVTLLFSLLLWSACPAQGMVIDFENLIIPEYGGVAVGNQYASPPTSLGILFNFPTALDYSVGPPPLPGFAHSGTKAVELCYGAEFCTVPLEMNFTTAQNRVKVWVGYAAESVAPRTVILRAFSSGDIQVDQATATLGPSVGPIPITTPLEVPSVPSLYPQIVRVTVGFTDAESGQGFNNGLAVDDVEFDTQGPPPPCPSTQTPTLTVTSPKSGQIFLYDRFTLEANVSTEDPFATVRLDVTGSGGGTATYGPLYISTGLLKLANLNGLLFAGENSVVVKVEDCRGSAQVTLPVYYRPDVTSTVIHVSDEFGKNVQYAQIFVDGGAVGFTGPDGRLTVSPPLPDGTPLAARLFMYESPTDRGNHKVGSYQNWKYRVYITSLPVDMSGAIFPQPVVLEPDPLAPQELQVHRDHTLIGLHLLASLNWDASEAELEDIRDHLNKASWFLFNATDGQMLFEQVELVDDRAFWDDADLEILAEYSLRAYVDCPRGGFFGGSWYCNGSSMHLPRPPCVGCKSLSDWGEPETYVHEFGHYGLDLGDEYSDDDPNTYCTRNFKVQGSPFCGDTSLPGCGNNPQTSCMMYWQMSAPKICSNRPENPHDHNTDQGDTSCWDTIVSRYKSTSNPPQWTMRTPDTRGIILGTINNSQLPVTDWAPRITIDNRTRPNLCQPISLIFNRNDGTHVSDAEVNLHTTYGAQILEGKTNPAGDITVTGVHVDDTLDFSKWEWDLTHLRAQYTVTAADCVPVVMAAGPTAVPKAVGLVAAPQAAITRQITATLSPFNVFVAFEPTLVDGQALIRVSVEPVTGKKPVELVAAPSVTFLLNGQDLGQPVPMQLDPHTRTYVGLLNGLSIDVVASVRVTATNRSNQTVTQVQALSMTGVDPAAKTQVFSTDGALSLLVPAGGLPAGVRVAIGPCLVSPPPLPVGFALVVGPFNVATSAGQPLNVPGTLRFQLPRLTNLPGASGFDPNTFRILHYNPATDQWDDLGSGTFLPSPLEIVTLHTQQLGVFVLVAHVAPPEVGPDVSNAVPTLAQLWPPNHQFVSVGITGVTASDGEPFSIVITRIGSDEPTQSNSPGDQCPDAINDGATARLRAERSGQGNGRIYTLYFTASDRSGHSNSGQVKVCVAHDQGGARNCFDDGLSIDATACPNSH